MHTKWSDGWDDTATVIALAEYLEAAPFVTAHPEYRNNGLDFIAITDHRTVAVLSDPAWQSERLILVSGEEFGSTGHANTLGISQFVDHDPDGDGVTLEDIEAGVEDTHAQGGVFSLNHPFLPGTPFPWNVRTFDAIEVWNSGWGLMSPTLTHDALAAWEADHGEASPMFARAVEDQNENASMQALVFYEALLARGIHVAVVGGSDRHTALLPGFPTTWIQAISQDAAGVIEGIRQRHTFVSRTPVSTQVLLSVRMGDTTAQMGDTLPVPPSGAKATLTLRVGRGAGGLLRLRVGQAISSDEALASAALGETVLEEPVVGTDFETSIELAVKPGTWFYPLVLDPLVRPDLTPEQADEVREMARGAVATGDEDFGALSDLAVSRMDPPALLWDATVCDPSAWSEDKLQCIPADHEGMASFFVPDRFDRALNVSTFQGTITDWAMGAVGSAVLCIPL